MVNVPDIVQSIIDQIPLQAKVLSVNGLRLYLCTTLHITVGKTIEDDQGYKYKVTDMEFDSWIEVEPVNGIPDPFEPAFVIAQKPLFFHGTPMSVADQMTKHESRDLNKVMPFIWLVDGYEYEEQGRESSIDGILSGTLSFLEWANTQKWTNDQHNNLAVKPMGNLAKAFGKVIEYDYNFKAREQFTYRDRVRFGIEVANKGDSRNIIPMDASGKEGRIRLEIYDVEQCSKNCNT